MTRYFTTFFSLLFVALTVAANAHEINPSIMDIEIKEDRVKMVLKVNAEAVLAEVDLSVYSDTNDAPQAEDYDRLRGLEIDALREAFEQEWPAIISRVQFGSETARLEPWGIEDITIEDPENLDLVRTTIVAATWVGKADRVQIKWPERFGPLILRQQGIENPYTAILENGEPSEWILADFGEQRSKMQIFVDNIPVGFVHILPKGWDHILFVLGLFFFSTQMRPLILQISLFTLAHTITLALAALGYVTVSGSFVEPLIALSICVVAIENIFVRRLTPYRYAIIFAFGLLHGLGFASVFADLQTDLNGYLAALVGFNIGVELGQLTVIAVAAIALWIPFAKSARYHPMIATPASIAIACVGLYWFVERVV